MDAGVEIFQIQKLIEGADHRAAQRGDLLFDEFDAQGVWRPKEIGGRGEHRCGLVRHGGYKQRKLQELELELLFTHAETAW